jgi:ubiquinone/menaquinone biosynthesis C-methylase UbiE
VNLTHHSEPETLATRRYVEPLEGHALWAATYDGNPNPILALEERTLKPLLPDLKNKLALDLACGTGRWFDILLRQGAASVVGVDFCAPMLERAATKRGIRGSLVRADCQALPIRSGAVDFALCSLALGYMTDVSSFAGGLAEVLRPGTRVFLSDLHPSAYDRGWNRSFRLGDDVVEIFSHCHPIEHICQLLEEHGFELLNLLEPGFDEPEREIFRNCGKAHLFDAVSGMPAIWVAQFSRLFPSGAE